MPRMRTISQAIKYLKEKDPNCAISEWYLRTLLRSGKLKHHKAGNKYLINLDYLEEYLKNPPSETEEAQYGTLRKVN